MKSETAAQPKIIPSRPVEKQAVGPAGFVVGFLIRRHNRHCWDRLGRWANRNGDNLLCSRDQK